MCPWEQSTCFGTGLITHTICLISSFLNFRFGAIFTNHSKLIHRHISGKLQISQNILSTEWKEPIWSKQETKGFGFFQSQKTTGRPIPPPHLSLNSVVSFSSISITLSQLHCPCLRSALHFVQSGDLPSISSLFYWQQTSHSCSTHWLLSFINNQSTLPACFWKVLLGSAGQ